MNIYDPNNKKYRKSFYGKISVFQVKKSQGIKIIGGDFNDILNTDDRISNQPVKCIFKSISKMMKTHNLIDIWKVLHKNIKQFTWRRKASIEKSRINVLAYR